MLDDKATSSAVTSSHESDVTRTNEVPSVSNSETVDGEFDVDTVVDVSSTLSLTSHAAGTDPESVDKPVLGQRSECRVCGDDATGMYFGALVCVPCKVCTCHARRCLSVCSGFPC